MAAWLLPALKAVLPHVGTIVTAAKPIFSKPREGDLADLPHALQEQISELQMVAAQNDAHIKELAEQLQTTVVAIQASLALAESKSRRLLLLSLISLIISLTAGTATLFALYLR